MPLEQNRLYYGYLIVMAGFVTQFIAVGMSNYIVGSFMIPMTEEFGWTRAEFSASRSIGQLVLAGTGFLIGSHIDRHGGRPFILVGGVILSVSCFALGNPSSSVYRGELQTRGLGMDVQVLDDTGKSLNIGKGELSCLSPFPSAPVGFWNDEDNTKYKKAYYDRFPDIWSHGDWAEITKSDGIIIYGRSDATLNPGGVRIGAAEIYREVEWFEEIIESIVVSQLFDNQERIVLFVKLKDGLSITEELKTSIRKRLRKNATHHHVPEKIISVPDIPRTISGKIVEIAVRNVVNGNKVKNLSSLANPEALDYFRNLPDLKYS